MPSPFQDHFSSPVARSIAAIEPADSPPSCMIQRPSTMTGEQEVKKRGELFALPSFRQRTLPVAASRQESVPRTPIVTIFPFATAGELRGPEKREAGPEAPRDGYLSCQSSLPVSAFRQRNTSFEFSLEKTYSLSPTKAGVATPSPTLIFHFCTSVLGHSAGALKPTARASRSGPRH